MNIPGLRSKALFCALLFVPTAASVFAALPGPPKLSDVDPVIRQAIAKKEFPGAVLLVAHRGRIVYRKAYGYRTRTRRPEPMTPGTIFDLDSLTKPVATASSVMPLFQQGKIRLDDPVARYLPEFAANGKGHIPVRMLLTHFSGLRPDPVLPPDVSGTDAVLRIIYADRPVFPPGMRFLYSDRNYIVLGELVRRASGLPLDVYAESNIFEARGTIHTRFRPRRERIRSRNFAKCGENT